MRKKSLLVGACLVTGALSIASTGVSSAGTTRAQAIFNVVDFGATGDGSTDDAPAFRSAIAAADAVAGSTVYVPADTYLVDRTSLSGTGVLDLTGVSDVAFVGDGASSLIRLRARDWKPVESPALFWCEECHTVSFADLTLDGSRGDPGFVGKEQMHGIDVRSSQAVTAERVRFQDMFGDGVRVVGEANALTENVDIHGCEFVANGRSGISVQGGARQVEFVDNHFEGTIDQDIDFEPTGGIPPDPVPPSMERPPPEDVLIESNTMVRSGALPLSVTIHGKGDTINSNDRITKRVQFINNVVNDGAVRVFNTADVLVEGNTIIHSGELPTLNVSGIASNTTIRNNTLEYGGGPADGVLNVARGASSTPTDIVIESNEVRALDGDNGLSFLQDVGPVIVRDNEIVGAGAAVGVSLQNNDGLPRDGVEISSNTIQNFTTPVRTTVVTHFRGTGSPAGVISAPVGSDFIRTDESDRLYVKQTGTGTSGWVAT